MTAPDAVALRNGRDTSDPGSEDLGSDVACGYIGGMTPHVWTPQQWANQSARYRLCIFVINPYVSPVFQAQQAVLALRNLKAPDRIDICADLETLGVPPGILDPFADEVNRLNGDGVCPYGSISSLFQHSHRSGYWVADPTGMPHMYDHPHVIGTQYAWPSLHQTPGNYDENLFVPQSQLRLWDTRPGPPPGTEQDVPADAWTRLTGTDADVLIGRATKLRVKVAA